MRDALSSERWPAKRTREIRDAEVRSSVLRGLRMRTRGANSVEQLAAAADLHDNEELLLGLKDLEEPEAHGAPPVSFENEGIAATRA